MIGLAYWSRDVLCVTRNGRRKHLFNPSAFALGVAAIAVVMFKVPEITHGENIAQTLGWPTHAYLWLFLMGFIVQGFFRVALVTMSSAYPWCYRCGVYLFCRYVLLHRHSHTRSSLLGHELVGDGSEHPQRAVGRMIFGALYGVLFL